MLSCYNRNPEVASPIHACMGVRCTGVTDDRVPLQGCRGFTLGSAQRTDASGRLGLWGSVKRLGEQPAMDGAVGVRREGRHGICWVECLGNHQHARMNHATAQLTAIRGMARSMATTASIIFRHGVHVMPRHVGHRHGRGVLGITAGMQHREHRIDRQHCHRENQYPSQEGVAAAAEARLCEGVHHGLHIYSEAAIAALMQINNACRASPCSLALLTTVG